MMIIREREMKTGLKEAKKKMLRIPRWGLQQHGDSNE